VALRQLAPPGRTQLPSSRHRFRTLSRRTAAQARDTTCSRHVVSDERRRQKGPQNTDASTHRVVPLASGKPAPLKHALPKSASFSRPSRPISKFAGLMSCARAPPPAQHCTRDSSSDGDAPGAARRARGTRKGRAAGPQTAPLPPQREVATPGPLKPGCSGCRKRLSANAAPTVAPWQRQSDTTRAQTKTRVVVAAPSRR